MKILCNQLQFNFFAVVEPKNSDKESDWRNGPGSLWYDLASVPKNATNYDYGFKLSTKCDTPEESPGRNKIEKDEDLYLMYNHLQWEDLVAWDNSQIKSPPGKHMELLYFSGIRFSNAIKDSSLQSMPLLRCLSAGSMS